MSSLFGEYATDIADAADDPFNLRDGTYRGAILSAEVKSGTKNDEANTPWAGTEVVLSAEGEDVTHTQFFPHPKETDTPSVRGRKLTSMKQFLSGCGIPESRMSAAGPEDLVDLEVVYTIRTGKTGFKNLEIRLADGNVNLDKATPFKDTSAAVSDESLGL